MNKQDSEDLIRILTKENTELKEQIRMLTDRLAHSESERFKEHLEYGRIKYVSN